MKRTAITGILLLLGAFSIGSVRAEEDPAMMEPRAGWDFESAGKIPVQAGGRIKPFDSLAREVILSVTGSRNFERWDPVELMISWVVYPREWEAREFVLITRTDVKRQLGLPEAKKFFSPRELLQNSALVQYADLLPQAQALAPDQKLAANGPRQDGREKELKQVLERVRMFRMIASGEGLTVQPAPEAWKPLADNSPEGENFRKGYLALFRAYHEKNESKFQVAASGVREQAVAGITDASVQSKLSAEWTYNRLRPNLIAWILYLLASLCWTLTAWSGAHEGRGRKRWTAFALTLTYSAVAIQVFGMGLRSYVAGRPPVSNMYESVIWVSLGVMVFASILYFIQNQRQPILLGVATALATLGLIAADVAPIALDPNIHPLVPVLRSNLWLTIHVLTITLGYAAFALTYGLANVALFHHFRAFTGSGVSGTAAKVNLLNQLAYRAMQFGVVLLAAGTILGGVWADYSWGRFWGWDPKEVWALIALLCYLAVLHGRYTGWIGSFGFAAWTVVCFTSVVMAWYGVNFVLGVGLHAYGFSSGGFGWVAVLVAVQMLFVAAVSLLRKRRPTA